MMKLPPCLAYINSLNLMRTSFVNNHFSIYALFPFLRSFLLRSLSIDLFILNWAKIKHISRTNQKWKWLINEEFYFFSSLHLRLFFNFFLLFHFRWTRIPVKGIFKLSSSKEVSRYNHRILVWVLEALKENYCVESLMSGLSVNDLSQKARST